MGMKPNAGVIGSVVSAVLAVAWGVSAWAAEPPRAKVHVYLLLGQSNMAGRGKVEAQDREVHPRVFMLDRAGQWVPATEPVQFDRGPATGVGPGLSFGKVMAEQDPSVRIALVPCAVGGSPISQWRKGGGLYRTMLARAKIAAQSGVLKGILWHQGENDSLKQEQADQYERSLHAMIAEMREDLGVSKVPFVAAELGEFWVRRTPHAPTVNDALRRLPERVPNTACVSSKGLGHKGDQVHFSAEAARELGRRYAKALIQLRENDNSRRKTGP
ncbi:MAG TPA: sialate O-acetylesterase [Planctomycetota bacterium]|nr:sialate O-acetylesterase [Planctomycetota bacterium]